MGICYKGISFFFFISVYVERNGEKFRWVIISQPPRYITFIAVWLAMVKTEKIITCIFYNLYEICDNFFRFFLTHAIIFRHSFGKAFFNLRYIFFSASLLSKMATDNIRFAHGISTILMQKLNNLLLEYKIAKCSLHEIVYGFITRLAYNAISQVVSIGRTRRTNSSITDRQKSHVINIGIEFFEFLYIAIRKQMFYISISCSPFPLKYRSCVISDTIPYFFVGNINIIRSQSFDIGKFASFIDELYRVELKQI